MRDKDESSLGVSYGPNAVEVAQDLQWAAYLESLNLVYKNQWGDIVEREGRSLVCAGNRVGTVPSRALAENWSNEEMLAFLNTPAQKED